MINIDLHIHSNYSLDGEFTPNELIEMCLKNEMKYVSLADHNTVSGIDEMIKATENTDLKVITGIELDCQLNGRNLQILGYYFDHKKPIFQEIEEDILKQEQQATELKLTLLKQLDVYVDEDAIMAKAINGIVTGEMMAEVLLDSHENKDNEILAPYRPGGERSNNPLVNFYWDFCADGKPLYVPINYLSLKEVINIVKDAGGVTILAHPSIMVFEDEEFLDEVMAEGLDGIEVYSSYHSAKQQEFYKSYALKHGYLMTYGTDFHGATKPTISLGCVVSDVCKKRMIQSLENLANTRK